MVCVIEWGWRRQWRRDGPGHMTATYTESGHAEPLSGDKNWVMMSLRGDDACDWLSGCLWFNLYGTTESVFDKTMKLEK